ncbi:MAG: MFS transporter [Spirochaetaceae bacterium]|nr:MFS transporter [Spirochaetaceae bacterium]
MFSFLLSLIYLAFISLGLPDALLGSAWPIMHGELNVPISYAGFISMIIAGGTIISSFFSDRIIKKIGTGLVTAISVGMTAFALLGFSISTKFWMLCLFSIPYGLGAGSVDAALNNFVALHYKARHMSWLHCFWGIGATLGPVIMGQCLINQNSWTLGYVVVSLIQIGLTIFLFCSLSIWKKASKTTEEQKEEISKSLSLKELINLPKAKSALVGFFCYCALESSAGLWGASYMVLERNIQPEIAAKWISTFYFGITIGRFLSGFITVKLSSQNMVRLGQFVLLLGVIIILLPTSINFLLVVGFLFIGLGCAPIYPSMLHSTPENFGKDVSQSIMGKQMASAYVGSTFMPPVVGFLVDNLSPKLFPFILFLILVLMFFMTERLYKFSSKKLNSSK